MTKLTLIVSALALVAGCQQDTKHTDRKLDELAKAVSALDAKITAMGGPGARAPQQQRKPPPEPDVKDVYAVPVDGDPSDGPSDALVTIVKGYEYACPYCEKIRPTFDQLKKDYGDKIRIVAKQYVVHPQVATIPSLAACAAHKQGKFEEVDALIWEKAYGARKFDEASMEAIATEAKLDLARFKADMKGDCVTFIAKDQADLQVVGMTATPTSYVNGRYLSGAQPVAAFKAIVEEEIKKAEERIAAGTPRAAYYKTWVLDKGLKKYTPKPQ